MVMGSLLGPSPLLVKQRLVMLYSVNLVRCWMMVVCTPSMLDVLDGTVITTSGSTLFTRVASN